MIKSTRIGLLVLLLAGCASGEVTPSYYLQAAQGQLEIWKHRRPIDEVIAAPDTTPAIRERLKLVTEIRDFASSELALPYNDSYRSYADIGRPNVVWNVFANPPLSIEPKTWCVPVAGCVGYLGFFSESAAREQAAVLRKNGMDVFVGGIPAYSTLGWFADPVLNTFINWSEPELARLIFHELAHQVLYVKDDTEFNESFAVTVEEAGVRRWLAQPGKEALLPQFERTQKMRSDFAALVLKYRDELSVVYTSATSDAEKQTRKRAAITALGEEYRRIKQERWGGFSGYDRWFGQEINNATLASVGLYQGLVPGFSVVLAEEKGELGRFYARVRQLSILPLQQRRSALEQARK